MGNPYEIKLSQTSIAQAEREIRYRLRISESIEQCVHEIEGGIAPAEAIDQHRRRVKNAWLALRGQLQG